MNTRAKGIKGETLAVNYLKNLGYWIEARNYSTPTEEIDIVARDGSYLVFVEVKSRKNDQFGCACEYLTKAQMKRICYAASHYINKFRLFESDVRFDVVEVYADNGEINHIVNAFESYL